MKKLREIVLAFSFMAGACLTAHAVCLTPLSIQAPGGYPYMQSYTTGPNDSCYVYYLDKSGNQAVLGQNIMYSDISMGPIGVGTSNLNTAPNTSSSLPVLVSTAIAQGMAIVATTQNQVGFVNGVMATTSGATANLGVADTAASSNTVVNVDYAGVSVALTTAGVTVGDLLVTTTTWPGYLVTNNSASAGAIIGTALATTASTFSGLTRILLHH